MKRKRSARLYKEAQRYLPGGVNSPVRAFRGVGGEPFFVTRGKGSKIYDADGNQLIDYILSWGPLILGHAHPTVIAALTRAARNGTSFGIPTGLEVTLARMITEALPSMEMVRLVNSGTEACMSAIRVARGYTGREKVVKCQGCYHGHADHLLVQAGSGATTLGIPDSAGVPSPFAELTITLPFNDLAAFKSVCETEGEKIACVIVEPIPGNMGVVPPLEGFLQGLREITRAYGIVLIFDEVITGFRVSYGGAQGLYGVMPDMTCLGKIIGGGLPVGAYGGKKEIMEKVAPLGPVYQAGTLSGNPLAVTAGITTLSLLSKKGVYDQLEKKTQTLMEGLVDAARRTGTPLFPSRVGSMGTLFFTKGPVTNYAEAKRADTTAFARFFWAMLDQGISLPPSQFEAFFLSTAHTHTDIEKTLKAARTAFKKI